MNAHVLPLRRIERWQIKVQNLPAWLWIVLPVLAMWPIWKWSIARFSDGSDDPLGIVAFLTLLILVWRDRRCLRRAPRPMWLAISFVLATLVAVADHHLSPLPRALLAVVATISGVMAVRNQHQPMLAWLGLGILALPLLSSLQFFAGYPLRVVTAEVSAWLLQLTGMNAVREGTALHIAGRLIIVDAPCSGIHMGWVAYFTAFATAAWSRLSDRQLLRRLPLLGVIIIAGNVIRNTLLIIKDVAFVASPDWLHDFIGLIVFAGVCTLVLWHMQSAKIPFPSWTIRPAGHLIDAANPAKTLTQSVTMVGFIILAVLPLATPDEADAHDRVEPTTAIEWPTQFEGQPLRPLALSAVEQTFAAEFPGAIARFANGTQSVTLRHVNRATRKLHPAADCYRGLGYAITHISLEQRVATSSRSTPALQRCFVATKSGKQLRVCEYIEDAGGHSFTDASSWYWAAIAAQSHGPWQAVTTASAI
jgi:exosortase